MRRYLLLAVLCAVLLGCGQNVLRAQGIAITNEGGDQLDINLRDADYVAVLTALFNTTADADQQPKYQFQIDPGVVGKIQRLQLTQVPFEKALGAILGTEFSYQKEQTAPGQYLYRISSRSGSTPSATPGPAAPTGATGLGFAPPSTSVGAKTETAASTPALGTPGLSDLSAAGGFQGTIIKGKTAADNAYFGPPIKINYLDITMLCTALGGSTLALFVTSSAGGTGGTLGASTSGVNTGTTGTTNGLTSTTGTTGTTGTIQNNVSTTASTSTTSTASRPTTTTTNSGYYGH